MQVVCATCAGAGDDDRLQMSRYKMVIIDEATQATEPSNIIPLVRPKHPSHPHLPLTSDHQNPLVAELLVAELLWHYSSIAKCHQA